MVLKRLLEIVVHRRGYKRKAYTYKRGGKTIHVRATWVRPTTYRMKDRGKPGKTPRNKRWFHPKRKLKVGRMEWKASHKAAYRRRVLSALVKKRGYATVVRELNALRNVTTDAKTKKAATADMKWLKKKYRGGKRR